jgi:hypothetical protein
LEAVPSEPVFLFQKEPIMFGERPAKGPNKQFPLKFVVAYRIDDEVTKQLMARVVESGYTPEQIARYALKRYLNEISRTEA